MMKISKCLAWILMTLFVNHEIRSQPWKWQHPLPQGNTLNRVRFGDPSHCYAIGDWGTILFSADQGLSWVIQYEAATDNLVGLKMSDALTGWIVGDNGVILHTTNGGVVWSEQSSGTLNGLNDVFFIDALHGWACGDDKTIVRTIDGGLTWVLTGFIPGPMGTILNGITFISPTEGWAVGSGGVVLHTINGGISWTYQLSLGVTVLAIRFSSPTSGYIVGLNGSIFSTANAGISWSPVGSGTTYALNDIEFAGPSDFWIAGDNGTTLHSVNAGGNWTPVPLNTQASANGIAAVENTVLSVGEFGLLARSVGGGAWTLSNNGNHRSINWIAFRDGFNGFGVGQDGIVLLTTNSGAMWVEQSTGLTGDSFYGVDVVGSSAWVVGDLGALVRTTDDGSSWTQQNPNTTNTLFSISFVDQNNGWAVGDLGTVVHTVNAGDTWTPVATGATDVLFGVKFKDVNNGWIVGSNGLILRTANGGSNWVQQASGVTAALYYVDLMDVNNGYCGGSDGTILKTTNGGNVWTRLNTGKQNNIYIVSGTSNSSVWAVGDTGLVLHSTNGGLAWNVEDASTSFDLFGLSVVNDTLAWLCGDYGVVERYGFPTLPAGTVGTDISAGWNMISNPVNNPVPDDSAKHLFPTMIGSAFRFQGGYTPSSTMSNGVGYWGKFPNATTNIITGSPLTQDSIVVSPGWNMVGSITNPVDTSTIVSVPRGIRTTNWFGWSGHGYVIATQILPGKAYWVKTNASGVFVMANPLGATYADRQANERSVLDELNAIIFNDSKVGGQRLYFGVDDRNEINLALFEMPPLPPAGIFDARFSTDRMFEGVREGETKTIPIQVSYAQYPLTISWEMKDQSSVASLMIGMKEIPMSGNGSVRVTDSQALLLLKLGGYSPLPKEFALQQNYPNPFNPTTTIKYDIPVDTRVTLKVFNILGQKVMTLVNEEQKAGYKSVEWNPSNYASGVYFYRLEASSFTSVKKLLLLR